MLSFLLNGHKTSKISSCLFFPTLKHMGDGSKKDEVALRCSTRPSFVRTMTSHSPVPRGSPTDLLYGVRDGDLGVSHRPPLRCERRGSEGKHGPLHQVRVKRQQTNHTWLLLLDPRSVSCLSVNFVSPCQSIFVIEWMHSSDLIP